MRHLLVLLLLAALPSLAQPILFEIPRTRQFRMDEIQPTMDLRATHLEAPDEFSKAHQLNELKAVHALRFGIATDSDRGGMLQKTMAEEPLVRDQLSMKRVFTVNGVQVPIPGGTPNDNTIAFGDSVVMTAVNSVIWAWDLRKDTFLFPQQFIPLVAASGVQTSAGASDPRLLYDPVAERWVLLFFVGSSPAASQIVVCFSQGKDPNAGWNTYTLPGNPLNNNRWSDFPSMAFTDDKLVMSINLIIPNVSWQVGFDGTVIWEMDKAAGYAGAATLPAELHHGFATEGRLIRNLVAVTGWSGYASRPMWASNRNFDAQNDSLFFLRRADSAVGGTHSYEIHRLRASQPYGLPPNGRQPSTPATDPSKGLQTNDGRWLGAQEMPDGSVHLVSTTRDFSTQRSAIYHGIIPSAEQPDTLLGHVIGDSQRFYGYPNLTWVGNEGCDAEVLIGFNHCSPQDFAGYSAVYYGNDGSYSPVRHLKSGLGNISKLGGAERWGDYFGIQQDYARPGYAWLAGFYALGNGGNGTFMHLLQSPDSTQLSVALSSGGQGCTRYAEAVPQGSGPFQFSWSDGSTTARSFEGCGGDTLYVRVTDVRGCSYDAMQVLPMTNAEAPLLFPNPSSSEVFALIDVPGKGHVDFEIFDASGARVEVAQAQVRAGRNEIYAWLGHLPSGTYAVRIGFWDERADQAESLILHRQTLIIAP
jgi:hypothetical protein